MSVELRFGDVQEFAKGKARVVFTDRDKMVSPWLSVGYRRTKGDREYEPLAVGEPVACLMADDGTSGVVLCSTFTDACPVPDGAEQHWTRLFEDGTHLTYDRESKKLTVALEGDAEVTVAGDLSLEVTGNATLEIAGNATVDVTGNATLAATGTVAISGAIVNLN